MSSQRPAVGPCNEAISLVLSPLLALLGALDAAPWRRERKDACGWTARLSLSAHVVNGSTVAAPRRANGRAAAAKCVGHAALILDAAAVPERCWPPTCLRTLLDLGYLQMGVASSGLLVSDRSPPAGRLCD